MFCGSGWNGVIGTVQSFGSALDSVRVLQCYAPIQRYEGRSREKMEKRERKLSSLSSAAALPSIPCPSLLYSSLPFLLRRLSLFLKGVSAAFMDPDKGKAADVFRIKRETLFIADGDLWRKMVLSELSKEEEEEEEEKQKQIGLFYFLILFLFSSFSFFFLAPFDEPSLLQLFHLEPSFAHGGSSSNLLATNPPVRRKAHRD